MSWSIDSQSQESREISVSSMEMQDLCPRETHEDIEGPKEYTSAGACGRPDLLSRVDVKIEISVLPVGSQHSGDESEREEKSVPVNSDRKSPFRLASFTK